MAEGKYGELQLRTQFLKILLARLQASRQAEDDHLELNEDDFELWAEELERNPTEISVLYERLVHEGFIREYDSHFPPLRGVIQVAWVSDLTDKGYTLVEELPADPQERLAASMDAFLEAISELEGISEEEKDRAEKAAEELKTFTRGLAPGAALQVLRGVAAAMGYPLP